MGSRFKTNRNSAIANELRTTFGGMAIFEWRFSISECRFENAELASGFKTNRKLQIGNRK
jgi:hypothetical protein